MKILASITFSVCLFLGGCQSWDWSGSSAAQTSDYGYFLVQQNNFNQQLATQRYLANQQAMINQQSLDFSAQQRYQSISRQLDSIQYSLNR